MNVLHVGSGFRPWRRGGLVAYVEDLLAAQVAQGHRVSYFFSGRHYPFLDGPRLRRYERYGIGVAEVVNSPLYDHGRQPELELDEPRTERMFARLLDELDPDVVHFQELAGLPSALIDVAADRGTPTVLTLQDYYLLCPMFKLLDADGQVCLRHDVGRHCVATVAAETRPSNLLVHATLRHDAEAVPLVGAVARTRVGGSVAHRLAGALAARSHGGRTAGAGDPAAAPAFQRRREVNLERMNRLDRMVAMSHRVAEIYEILGVRPGGMRVVHLTLEHIAHLRPRRASGRAPVTFGTLAALESPAKGGRLLIDALRRLAATTPSHRYRVVVFGTLDAELATAALDLPSVELRGRYAAGELDAMLDEVDVGLLPSVWEEAYGYAGVEFLAKGIPVVANAIGGMVDYTREGETGWLNRSCSAEGLAEILRRIVDAPEQVADLNARVLAERDSLVKPIARHAEEMDALYAEAIAARRESAASGEAPRAAK